MKYTTEDINACSKKISVTVEAEEVEAAITAALKMQQQGLSMAGFRKGHVPLKMIESRFKGQIYRDAAQDLTSVHINEFLGELKLRPISALKVDPDPIQLERGKDCCYTVTFEHMPAFELPVYEGVEVEQQKAGTPGEETVNSFIERLRRDRSTYEPANGEGPAVDGQMVNLDLEVVEGDKVLHSIQGQDLIVGQRGAEIVDELVKTVKVGESNEKEVTFPTDFMLPALQGKTAVMKVKVYAIRNLKQPDDDALVAALKLDSMDDLKHRAAQLLTDQLNLRYRTEAKDRMLYKLADMVDFELPQSLVQNEISSMIYNDIQQAQRMGKTLDNERVAGLHTVYEPVARRRVKCLMLMMAIAEKEGLTVTEQEVKQRILDLSAEMHVDPNKLFDYYRENGYLYTIRDDLLNDKASESVYRKAKVVMVDTLTPQTAPEAAPAAETAPEADGAAGTAPETEAAPEVEGSAGAAPEAGTAADKAE